MKPTTVLWCSRFDLSVCKPYNTYVDSEKKEREREKEKECMYMYICIYIYNTYVLFEASRSRPGISQNKIKLALYVCA